MKLEDERRIHRLFIDLDYSIKKGSMENHYSILKCGKRLLKWVIFNQWLIWDIYMKMVLRRNKDWFSSLIHKRPFNTTQKQLKKISLELWITWHLFILIILNTKVNQNVWISFSVLLRLNMWSLYITWALFICKAKLEFKTNKKQKGLSNDRLKKGIYRVSNNTSKWC